MYKKRIGIIFGGRSAEHDVSLKSAAAVIRNLNSIEEENGRDSAAA